MEFLVGTIIGVLGLAVAVFTALRSRQLSHADFSLRVGEQSVRSKRLTKNPKHLIYLAPLGSDQHVMHCQISYAVRNISKKSLHNINITIDVPEEFCMPKSKIGKLLSEHGMSELLEHEFFKSRKISGYLKKKRIEYRIDTLGPKQEATLAEVLDLSNARLPEPIPVPITLNGIMDCMREHEEIRNFVPLYISVSAQDIEPKSETFFFALIDGDIKSIKKMPRKRRKMYKEGEYRDTGVMAPVSEINLRNYIDAFWLGNWPSGRWLYKQQIRLPWKRRKMFKAEECHIVPIDDESIQEAKELNHPHFSGEIAYLPMSVPNFDYLSTEFNFQSSDEIMDHLGFRRPEKNEILIMRVVVVVLLGSMIFFSFFFEDNIEAFGERYEAFLRRVFGALGFDSL